MSIANKITKELGDNNSALHKFVNEKSKKNTYIAVTPTHLPYLSEYFNNLLTCFERHKEARLHLANFSKYLENTNNYTQIQNLHVRTFQD